MHRHSGLAAIVVGRRSRWVVICTWLALAGAAIPLQGPLARHAADESDTFLARGSESAEAKRIIEERFPRGREIAAVIAYVRDGVLIDADGLRADADADALCRSGEIPSLTTVATRYKLACGRSDPLDVGPGPSLLVSPDNSVILSTVLMTDDSTPAVEAAVAAIRDVVPPAAGDATGLRAFVTGRAGFEADRSDAVKGIDETLLMVTLVVLGLLLLLIYRSPIVALMPLVVVAVAYLVAAGLVYSLVVLGVTAVSGQTTAIMIVLMFGAGTDYCLLMVARFREERRTRDVEEAMTVAARRTAPAIVAAGGVVVGAMSVLALADFNATREMGPLLALGVVVMVCAGLTLLPAVFSVVGPRAFRPTSRSVTRERGVAARFWRRTARLVRARPAMIAAATTTLLAAGAMGNIGGRETLDFSESFRRPPDSVRGQQVIRERFIPGRAAPVRIVTDARATGDVTNAITNGTNRPVAEMYAVALSTGSLTPGTAAGVAPLTLSDAELRMDPFSDRATNTIPALRETTRRAAGGKTALIGGTVAEAYDTREAVHRDTWLIVPVSLMVILLVLVVLLRALVMPLYVIATVILSFSFALGVSSLIFTHVFGQPASDPSLPQFAFIFLVALGVDYNVFLLSRIREERRRHDTRRAVQEALEQSGGVITSAGIVLAATFATLMALPMEAMFQIGFVIAVGLLVDTFLVRALLVPALAVMLGERNWWPSRPPAYVPAQKATGIRVVEESIENQRV